MPQGPPAALRALCAAALTAFARGVVFRQAAEEGFYPRPKATVLAGISQAETHGDDFVPAKLRDYNVSVMTYKERDHISMFLQRQGQWEPVIVKRICNAFKAHPNAGRFLDVGANIGAYSLSVADCLREKGNGGGVISVEGSTKNQRLLRAGIKYNELGNVHLYGYMVGDETLEDEQWMSDTLHNHGMATVIDKRHVAQKLKDPNMHMNPVGSTTLDSIFRKEGRPGIFALKMDIEGYEMKALRGAEELIKSRPCILFIEVHKDPDWKMRKHFEGLGYVYVDDGWGPGKGGLDALNNIWMERPDLAACAEGLRAGGEE